MSSPITQSAGSGSAVFSEGDKTSQRSCSGGQLCVLALLGEAFCRVVHPEHPSRTASRSAPAGSPGKGQLGVWTGTRVSQQGRWLTQPFLRAGQVMTAGVAEILNGYSLKAVLRQVPGEKHTRAAEDTHDDSYLGESRVQTKHTHTSAKSC